MSDAYSLSHSLVMHQQRHAKDVRNVVDAKDVFGRHMTELRDLGLDLIAQGLVAPVTSGASRRLGR